MKIIVPNEHLSRETPDERTNRINKQNLKRINDKREHEAKKYRREMEIVGAFAILIFGVPAFAFFWFVCVIGGQR